MRQRTKLNKPEVKIVIQDILEYNWGVRFPLEEIKIYDGENIVRLCGEDFITYDKHHHYTNAKDHPIAIYLFLAAIDDVSKNTKRGMFVKDIPEIWKVTPYES